MWRMRYDKNICFSMAAILFLFFVGTSLNLEPVNAQNSHVELIIQGASLIDHGMPNEAILIFDEILSEDPKHVTALIGKGMALKHLQKFEEARNFLDTALELEPDNLDVKIERLDVLRYLKDHDEIRRSLVEILGSNLEKIEYFNNPSCFACFGNVPFLHPMRDTDDYIGSAHFEMRDSNDNLVGVVESDLIWYPTHPIFDSSL
jgi:tetratricopeptide (TPR) repeat protein